MKPEEFTGIWWLPSEPENQLTGTLKIFDNGEVNLTTIGSFKQLAGPITFKISAEPTILGITSNGKFITLCGCLEKAHRESTPGFPIVDYIANSLYEGAHIKSPETVKFNKITVGYAHLRDWVRITGFRREINSIEKLSIEYIAPEIIKGSIENGSVEIINRTQYSEEPFRRISISENFLIHVESKVELLLDSWFNQYIFPLQNLLTLATFSPNMVTELSVFSKHTDIMYPNNQIDSIRVIFEKVKREEENNRMLIPEDLIFSLKEYQGDFAALIDNWLRTVNKLENAYKLFFSIQYNPNMFLEHKFLNTILAVETYHRETQRFNNKIFPDEEHSQILKHIKANVEEKYKTWLSERLNYSNEVFLRNRISDIFDFAGEAIMPLVMNKETFIKNVKDTRNFFIHHDRKLEKKALKGAELFHLFQALSFLLRACFMIEIGFPQQRCLELFQRNRYYVAVREQFKKT